VSVYSSAGQEIRLTDQAAALHVCCCLTVAVLGRPTIHWASLRFTTPRPLLALSHSLSSGSSPGVLFARFRVAWGCTDLRPGAEQCLTPPHHRTHLSLPLATNSMWDQYERAQRRKRELARGATPTPEDGVQISLADLNARKTADAGSARHTARATSGHASGYDSAALGDDEEGGDLSVDGAESRYAVKSSPRTSVKVVTKRPWPGGSGDVLESIQESPPRKRRAIEPAMPTRSSPRKSVMAKAKGTTVAPAGPASSSSAPVAAAQPILPASHLTPPSSPTPKKGKGKAALPTVATHLPMDVDRLLNDIPTPPTGKHRLISDKASQSMNAAPSSSSATRAPKRSGTASASLLEGPSSTPDISSTKGNIATSTSRKKVAATTKPPTAAQLRKLKKQAEEQAKSERDALFARERQMKHPEFIAYLPEKAGIHGLPPARERYLTGTVILYVHCEKNRVSEPSRARYWMVRLGVRRHSFERD